MLATPLPYIEVNPPSQDPTAVVIWLHGLGANGHDFEPIVPQLQLPESLPIRFIFPHAPNRNVTLNGGASMPAWFDIGAAMEIDQNGLKKSVFQVKDLIQQEVDRGIPSNRIILAGFSQGGAVALETALFLRKPLAGILALSTFLLNTEGFGTAKTATNADIPIMVCHGEQDPMLPLMMGRNAFESLEKADYNVSWHQYPMAHEVCLPEINHISQWFQKVLG